MRHLARSDLVTEDPVARVREFLTNAPAGVDAHPIGNPDEGRYWVTQRAARLDIPLSVLRAMATQPGDAGGYLVGDGTTREPVQSPVLDARLARLGVVYDALPRPILDQLTPVSMDLPSAQWLGEADPLTETAPAIERHRAAIRHVGCGVSYSRHLAKLSAGRAERLVARMVPQALARALDAAVLAGDGLLEPLGLLSQVPELGVAAIDATAVLDAVEDLEGVGIDAERLGIVAAPSVKRALAAITYDGRALWRTEAGRQYVAGIPALVSDAMPATELLMGDFARVTVHHAETVHLVQVAVGPDDRREAYAFLAAALTLPAPSAFVRIRVNA